MLIENNRVGISNKYSVLLPRTGRLFKYFSATQQYKFENKKVIDMILCNFIYCTMLCIQFFFMRMTFYIFYRKYNYYYYLKLYVYSTSNCLINNLTCTANPIV